MSNVNYVSPIIALKQFGVSRTTLAKFAKDGKIRSIRTQGDVGQHRYCIQDLQNYFLRTSVISQSRIIIIYARVSSSRQDKECDLDRQIEILKNHCPNYTEIIKDIGSGVNFKRKGFLSLLE